MVKRKYTWRMKMHIRMLEKVKICLAQMNRRNHSNQFDQTCKRAYFTLFYQWQYNPIIIQNLPKFNKTLNENFNLQLTGKSFSEALILASINPQYGKRLFIEFL